MSGDLDHEYLETVEAENSALRDRIAELEELLGLTAAMPAMIALTKHEAMLLGIVLKREFVSKTAAMMALYGRLDETPDTKIVDVFLSHLRKKLNAHGIKIETKWGEGIFMDAANKALVRALMQKAIDDAS